MVAEHTAPAMTVAGFYGRRGLRLDDIPYLTVCDEPGRGVAGEPQVQQHVRDDGRTTEEVLAEIARRWNAHEDMLEALRGMQQQAAHIIARYEYQRGEYHADFPTARLNEAELEGLSIARGRIDAAIAKATGAEAASL